jgi:ubiquinone/menaquinone biosynthesis C-methylase UbiE
MSPKEPLSLSDTRAILSPDGYDQMIGCILPCYRLLLESIPSFLPRGAVRILELGCGTGASTVLLRKAAPHARIIGIDPSPEMLGIARTKPELKDVSLIQGDFRKLWPPGHFNAIVTTLCMHSIAPGDRATIVRYAGTSLAPGGRFICGDIFRPGHRWEEKVYRAQWMDHMRKSKMPDAIVRNLVARREAKYRYLDTMQMCRLRLEHSGFSRTIVPVAVGILGLVVGCISNKEVLTGYLE